MTISYSFERRLNKEAVECDLNWRIPTPKKCRDSFYLLIAESTPGFA